MLFRRSVLVASSIAALAACGQTEGDRGPLVAPVAGVPASSGDGVSAGPGGGVLLAGPVTAGPGRLSKVLEGDWADRLLAIVLEQGNCTGRLPKLEALATAAERAGQPVWQAEIVAVVATCFASEGNGDQAIALRGRALDLGFGDCFFLRTDKDIQRLAGRRGLRCDKPDFGLREGKIAGGLNCFLI